MRIVQKNAESGKLPKPALPGKNMSQPSLSQETVLDLVPFGATLSHTGFYALRLSLPKWEGWQPGQFVMLRPVDECADTMWGRPFSICLVTKRDLVLFFQVVGRATARMSRLKPGDKVNIWGPLGNGMHMEPNVPTLLLAGGIGIVPFVGYAHMHPTPWELSMDFGHRMPLNCYPFDSMNEKILVDPHLEKDSSDRERFTALLDERIQEYAQSGLVMACGPTPFLKVVQALSAKHNARTQLCLETRMACGVGACLGCVVRAALPPENSVTRVGGAGEQEHHHHEHHHMPHEFTHVQTCTCGPNFWADTVLL